MAGTAHGGRGADEHSVRDAEPDAIEIEGDGDEATEPSRIFVEHGAPQVTVERPALAIHWEQEPPQITVRQATPHVTVHQLPPIITVRQPPPTITVEWAEPEIIVRMPEPDVDVSIEEPQIEVSVSKPRVEVVQPEQPVVDISAGEPRVSLMPRSRAEVAVDRAEPQVFYERIGQPRIKLRQANGGPRIRFERLSREEALQLASATSGLLPSRLEGREVFDSVGESVGTARRVLVGHKGDVFIALDRRGFLTRKLALVPIESFTMWGDRLVMPEMKSADVQKLTDWDGRMDSYAAASADSHIRIPLKR